VQAGDAFFQDGEGFADYFGDYEHGGLSLAEGLGLSEEFVGDVGVEGVLVHAVGLAVEDLEECGFGEEGVGVAVVVCEHLQDGFQAILLADSFHFILYYYVDCPFY
jgi:hypothetical protein